jgi:hypothetical protein
LVVQFSFDILINLNVLHGLVFDVLFVQVIVYRRLKHIEVVDMLSNVIYSSLKALDIRVVPSDSHPVFNNVFSHVRLLVAELINNKTKIGVNFVVPSERFIHVVGVHLQLHNLLLTRGDGTL